ncbi:hypothetical protein D3C87_1460930 [compost metagenome]
MNHRCLIVDIIQPVHQFGEVRGVFLVQRAMRAQIAEGGCRKRQILLDLIGCVQRKRDAGAFQHVNHPEKSHRILAGDRVIGIGHHHLGLGARPGQADLVSVLPQRPQIIQDPGVVPGFLFDVFVDGRQHPGQPGRHAGTARMHQWHGMADVVVGLAQECDVGGQGDLAAQAILDDRNRHQRFSAFTGLSNQFFKKGHDDLHQRLCGCPRKQVGMQVRHGGTARAAVGGGHAAGRAELGPRAHPRADPRVVGKCGVGAIDTGAYGLVTHLA